MSMRRCVDARWILALALARWELLSNAVSGSGHRAPPRIASIVPSSIVSLSRRYSMRDAPHRYRYRQIAPPDSQIALRDAPCLLSVVRRRVRNRGVHTWDCVCMWGETRSYRSKAKSMIVCTHDMYVGYTTLHNTCIANRGMWIMHYAARSTRGTNS